MSKRDSTLTQERLKAVLDYDPRTGIFVRRIRTSQNNRAGDIAGGITRTRAGYIRANISVGGVQHRAHRLAWLYMTGAWPTQEIDHIDGDATNNAFGNLREVSRRTNCENQHRPSTANTSGFTGVFYEKRQRKFIAKIVHIGKQIHIGTFEKPEEAHAAYLSAKRKLHEGCTI